MADESSFDVVSKVDVQIADDAINAGNKEIATRFDFRGSISKIEFDKKTGEITLTSDDEGKLKSVIEILRSRFAKKLRGPEAFLPGAVLFVYPPRFTVRSLSLLPAPI